MGSRIPLDSTSAQPGRGEAWRRRAKTGGEGTRSGAVLESAPLKIGAGVVLGAKPGSNLRIEGVVVEP